MAQTYTREQIIQAGKDLIDLLLNVAKSNNNLTGFIKEYLISLTSNEGIYRRQQDEMEKFSQSSEDVHNSIAKNSASSAQQISEVCGDFAQMNKAIVDVHTGRAETDLEVKKLSENLAEIQKLIHDIQDVSAMTNLLSFNASIEAARAGAAGKGFRIIANEVKALSSRTQEVSEHIDNKILEMQKNAESFIAINEKHGVILNGLQDMAQSSMYKLEKISEESRTNAENANVILGRMNESIAEIQEATKSAEAQNLAQVEQLAQKAVSHTMQVDDELSFLFELKALFEYMDANRGG